MAPITRNPEARTRIVEAGWRLVAADGVHGATMRPIAVDGGLVTRPLLESLTRYFLGDRIAGWLDIPRHAGQDELLALSWPQFVRLKEAGLLIRGSSELYWFFDEILRLGTLWYLGEGRRLSIEIPDVHNPNHS